MKIKKEIKEILNIDTNINEIIFSKSGLKKHMIKKNHYSSLKYFEKIEEIINKPDYVGKSPREKSISLEYIKCYNDNILVAVKLNRKKSAFYIASMYIISDYKLQNRINSGRLIKLDETKE